MAGVNDSQNEAPHDSPNDAPMFAYFPNATGVAKVVFVGSSGDPVELHRRTLNKGDPWMLATNSLEQVTAWAHRFFQRGLERLLTSNSLRQFVSTTVSMERKMVPTNGIT